MNQRSILTPSISDAPSLSRTIAETVYHRIREDVVAGRLAAGDKLPSHKLMARYECGVSPLREALSRLVSERLVASSGQRGFRVATITAAEMWDITHVRQTIEAEALVKSIESGADAWEEEVVASFHSLAKAPAPDGGPDAPDEWERRHRRFHRALVSACPSPWLIRLTDLLYDHSERYRRARLLYARVPDLSRSVTADHKKLMTLALKRDAAGARALLIEHLQRTADILSALLKDGAIGSGIDGPKRRRGKS